MVTSISIALELWSASRTPLETAAGRGMRAKHRIAKQMTTATALRMACAGIDSPKHAQEPIVDLAKNPSHVYVEARRR